MFFGLEYRQYSSPREQADESSRSWAWTIRACFGEWSLGGNLSSDKYRMVPPFAFMLNMKTTYNHCPLCGTIIKEGESLCKKCEFNHLEIDLDGTKDIDQIRAEQDKRNIKLWSKGFLSLTILLLSITIILPLYIAYSKYQFAFNPFLDPDFQTLAFQWFAILGIVSGIIIYNLYKRKNSQVNGFLKERSEIIEKVKAANEHEKIERMQLHKYGEGYISLGYEIFVNENSNKIFIGKNSYNFSDILDFSVKDNSITIHSTSTSTAKTNNKNMLGRAVIGGVLLGTAGAVIGGTTASKNIEHSESKSRVSHDYSVIITVNNIASPVETIRLWGDETALNRIVSTLTVILNRNREI